MRESWKLRLGAGGDPVLVNAAVGREEHEEALGHRRGLRGRAPGCDMISRNGRPIAMPPAPRKTVRRSRRNGFIGHLPREVLSVEEGVGLG